ncbi:glycosyltransferase family 4 protein [Candidatus Saccharibacteria bacterium]|nr:glycosyltransferase family 4 protein [Candidatus Saccharibacteria bacterium]
MKSRKDSSNDFIELNSYIRELEMKNKELVKDNAELARRLDSKRYKAVDLVVDSAYSLARKTNNKRLLIKRNLNNTTSPKKKEKSRKTINGRIDIININFYDWDGKTLYKGGAERYVFDLACLLKKKGFSPRILQCSNTPFEKKYNGIEIIGIGGGSKSDMRKDSFLFSRYCHDAELIIASPLELASEIYDIPVIGINHGINFDGDWNHYNKKYLPDYSIYIDSLKNVKSCVCVDTNFINWTRTVDYESSLKEKFIPNYYDEEQFKVSTKKGDGKKVTFVYPRRIYNARGADITIEAFDKLLSDYNDKVVIRFVGQVDNEEIGKKLETFMNKYPKNVFHEEYDMKDMHKAYEGADVVLVPTRYCEGTSLSCIEGMVSGATIITTNVGGLPNLVIDGFNGRLISPTTEELYLAAKDLIEHPKERERMAKNGRTVAESAFSKSNWNEKWEDEINRVLKKK